MMEKKYQLKNGLCWIIYLVIICQDNLPSPHLLWPNKTTVTSIYWPDPKKYPSQTKIFKKASQAATCKSQKKN